MSVHGLKLLEGGPYDGAELAAAFRSAPLKQLRTGWVACVVDSHSDDMQTLASLTRALLVIAERLHGVETDPPIKTFNPLRITLMPTDEEQQAGFAVVTDAPPPPAAGRTKRDPLRDAIEQLRPGQHITVRPSSIKKATLGSKLNSIRKDAGLTAKHLYMYTATTGDYIVIRREVAE